MRTPNDARSRRKKVKEGGSGPANRGATAESVGYARPPTHTRFKAGKSGNPQGRPKNSKNLKSIIQSALTATVVLREGTRKRSISKLEGIVLKQVESALKGNEKAALATLKMAAQVGLLEVPDGSIETLALSQTEQEMVDELLLQSTKRRRSRSRG